MKNYLEFESDIKSLEEQLDKLKDPFNNEGLAEVDTKKINQIQNEMKDVTKENIEVSGPVKDERQKLDAMSKTLGIDSKSKSDEELREIIKNKIGQPENETRTKK